MSDLSPTGSAVRSFARVTRAQPRLLLGKLLQRAPEALALGLDLIPSSAAREVVVDEAHRLHERVRRRRTYERPAAPAQVLAHGDRLLARRSLRGRCRIRLEGPDIGAEAAGLADQLEAALRVVHGGLDLRPVSNDAGVAHQPRHVAPAEVRHSLDVEAPESRAEVL